MVNEINRFCECFAMCCSKFYPEPNVHRESAQNNPSLQIHGRVLAIPGFLFPSSTLASQGQLGLEAGQPHQCDARSELRNQVSNYPTRSASSTSYAHALSSIPRQADVCSAQRPAAL